MPKILHQILFLISCLSGTTLAAQPVEGILNTEVEITFEVKSIAGLNSSFADFSPLLVGNKLLFTSDRAFDFLNWGEDRWKKKKFLNVYACDIKSTTNDSLIIGKANLYLDELNHVNHTGPICISADGNEIIFTQVEKEKHKINKPQLYSIKKENGKWAEKKKLEFCTEDFSFGHPTLSADGNVLYFSSDMSGTVGGKDIFYSERNSSGWSAPKNAGTHLNTEKDEVFPYFANGFLYFSSNGGIGMGGLDLFKSKTSKTGFSVRESLGETINSKADDFGFCFTADLKNGFFSSNREGGKGDDDIYFVKVIEKVTVLSKDLTGKFTYRNLKTTAGDLEILLMDGNDSIVMRTRSDSNGVFTFRQLALSDNYTIRVITDNPDIDLEIIDQNGVAVAFFKSDKNGSFLYKKLDAALTGTLSLMEVEDTPLGKTGKVSGQFIYEKLPGVYPDGMTVYLVDDNGQIVQRVKTDNYGNFTFRQLALGENYQIKTEANSDDLLLMMYNRTENVVAEFRRDENGVYVFRKLSPEAAGNLATIESKDDSLLVAKQSVTLAGQFKYRELNGAPNGLKFVVTDESGAILYRGVTDDKGFFRVRNLPVVDQYIFQMDASDENFGKRMQLDLFNRTGRSLALLENDKYGRFVFKRLKQEFSYISEISVADLAFIESTPNIYFDLNSRELTDDAKKTLERLITILKMHPELKLEIGGFADSRADESFNLNLSDQRMRAARAYLITRGIAGSRIKGKFYGEGRLVNGCKDGVICEEDQHRMNRRCEFHVIQPLP